ncbi:sodium- and chloride-dependent glycine transporter 1 isoform X2 [Cimex lectularius]|nr:sodium- and chloride-dependent glycine transporter 1 isoform X2 [Cimex lectularius]XP_024081000.1 sodium- and chloride-dependent glycine transporter 1 isoform X2 [Cimex lectularius]
MDGEVDLIEFEEGSPERGADERRGGSAVEREAEQGCEQAKRRLLITEWDEAWARIVPEKNQKKTNQLKSLGDEADFLDAILGNMVTTTSDSEEPSTSGTGEYKDVEPSAPPLELDWDDTWDMPGGSGSAGGWQFLTLADSTEPALLTAGSFRRSRRKAESADGHRSSPGRRTRSASPSFPVNHPVDVEAEVEPTTPETPPTPPPMVQWPSRPKESRRDDGGDVGTSSGMTNSGAAGPSTASEIQQPQQQPQQQQQQQQWLRQSMRRITHFRLEDPPSPRQPSPVPVEDAQPTECEMANESLSPLGQWPHGLSSMLACLACTLGIFNISRFAILSVQFGANFILQFFLMSFILGIPLFTFHVSLGQLLGAGSMDMWKISPIFQGIGIALILTQALLGIYSIVGVSWMFVYFRDSFITKQDTYRWAEPYIGLLGPGWRYNSSLEETVPDYFSGVVLQRHTLISPANAPGHLKFQVTFNLAVVWMIVFISLSKGLKSYGKVVFLFSLVPTFGMLVLCTKLVSLTPITHRFHLSFPQTDWSEFFLNTKSWSAAMSEAFYTWGLLGSSAMQMASHNRPNHLLHRDTTLVTIITFSILVLAAFLANMCSQLLLAYGYLYVPSSFEKMSTYGFLHPTKLSYSELPPSLTTPVRFMTHNQYLTGEKVVMPGANLKQESGYQALRLATELVPATLAIIGSDRLSPFWSVLFYFILILFGIAQQLAIMHCVITGIMAIKVKTMKNWETTITLFTCVCGFILGLPMATELGIFVVYFLDYCVGGAWWIMLLYLIELVAVFMVRGRPYSGETIVATLFTKASPWLQNWAAPILCFIWNVILPVVLMVLCILVFKNGSYKDLYKWNAPLTYDYWPVWSRELGSLIQILPLLTIPFIGIVQSCRYLSKGPSDIFDRLQMLYRPSEESIVNIPEDLTPTADEELPATSNPVIATIEDPPPKYTPPPSYSTATGARIAKFLRQSFRRSLRRITHSLNTVESGIENPTVQSDTLAPPPPDYAAVLVEINQSRTPSSSNQPSDIAPTTSTLTVNEVAQILRSSFRRAVRDMNILESTSSERLVESATPISRDRIIMNQSESDKTIEGSS